MSKHKWTFEENILVFYLYRFENDDEKINDEKINKESVRKYMGFANYGSINMKISNFKAADGKGRLSHNSRDAIKVYDVYKDMSQNELRQKCLAILSKQ